MLYNGDRARAQQLAAQYGLIVLAPPIGNAGWWLPGENGTECFAFVRQGTEVRWLREQEHESAHKEFVAKFNQERRRSMVPRTTPEAGLGQAKASTKGQASWRSRCPSTKLSCGGV
jgi:hypothetical protein